MQSLPVLFIRATCHYDVGKTIGRSFKRNIEDYHRNGDITASLQKFYSSRLGKEQFDQYLDVTSKCFPEVIEEIQGLADGAGLSFDDIFLYQFLSEILLVHEKEIDAEHENKLNMSKNVDYDVANRIKGDDVTHCTGILVNNKGFRMVSHNEDWGLAVKGLSFLVHVTIENESRDSTVEEFASYVHPGLLPGLTFSMNRSLVLTVNTLLPVNVNKKSVPVAILLRKLLICNTIDECAEVMKNKSYGCAYGININVASIHGNDMCSLEVYPEQDGTTRVSVLYLDNPGSHDVTNYYCHCNHYTHISGVKELECTKSRRIETRVKQLKPPANDADVRRILGDVDDVAVPIYKDPSPQNEATGSRTVATAVFNLTEKKLDVYVSSPSLATSPCVTLPFF